MPAPRHSCPPVTLSELSDKEEVPGSSPGSPTGGLPAKGAGSGQKGPGRSRSRAELPDLLGPIGGSAVMAFAVELARRLEQRLELLRRNHIVSGVATIQALFRSNRGQQLHQI